MKLLYLLTFADGLRGNFKKKKNQSNLQSKLNVTDTIELPFMISCKIFSHESC